MIPDNVLDQFRITSGETFRLADHDPGSAGGLDLDKSRGKDLLKEGVEKLATLQEKLYAHDRWSLLLIFQAMDAAGKDGVIKHVMSGVNPQGCQVHSFKAPSPEELDHDFLWRTTVRLPERGRIGIFNRSYYEEVLVVRVHPEMLQRQKLPPALVTPDTWQQRFEDIGAFERMIARNGIIPIKFFLNVSKEEQRQRFLSRLEEPEKRWKFSMGDVAERKLWDRYMEAYEAAIRATATPEAPWYVVPADKKWFTQLVVGGAIVSALEKLDLHFPKVDPSGEAEMAAVRKALRAEGKTEGKAARGKLAALGDVSGAKEQKGPRRIKVSG